jgi:three-Cys-motif partner protein
MDDDGLYLPEIRAHSLEKIRRHDYYAALFSKAMAKKWPRRAYIGLYAGAGRARVKGAGEIVETSALNVLRQEVPFTDYILVDKDPLCVSAMRARIDALKVDANVTLIQRAVNESVPEIVAALPAFGPREGLLSLCFVDPFRVDLDFDVIRQLSRYYMDFLIMLPFGFDLRRNVRMYLANEEDERVARLIGSPDWRKEWRAAGKSDRAFIRFVADKFDEAMTHLGYRRRDPRDTVTVKVTGKGVYLYSLAFYSRHELGERFWKTTIAGTDPQIELDF